MVKQHNEHCRKTELYVKILNKALEIGDNHLAWIVKNKLKHHHQKDYAIATPTGCVIIRFPGNEKPSEETAGSPYVPTRRTNKVWLDWAIGLSVFPGSLLAMVGLVLKFS